MTAVNFAVAVPPLARRVGGASLLAAGVLLTLLGTAWLSQADATTGYLAGVALPMLLVGARQGLAFAPLTSFGIVDAPAGAASGLVNTFHQLGMAPGLAVLVSVSADASDLTAASRRPWSGARRSSAPARRPAGEPRVRPVRVTLIPSERKHK
jgi:hypothetical protein